MALRQGDEPRLARPVPVVTAKQIPYVHDANRFQKVSIYMPETPETLALVGIPVISLPKPNTESELPRYHVFIHGGAWRDPELTSESIEHAVAHTLSAVEESSPMLAIASIDYSVSPFLTLPALPHEAMKNSRLDPARDATHPQRLSDVLLAFALLRSFGLNDRSYVLSGRSCGACLALQAILQPPGYDGLEYVSDAPRPAAVIG